jgi:hypothetical protein
MEKISFTKNPIPPKVLCDTELAAVDADGNRHSFRPQAHVSCFSFLLACCLELLCQYVDYLHRIKQFYDRVESGYINGQPLHIADPNQSGFAIISDDKFRQMSAKDVQELFRQTNVVVTGCQHPDLKFDEEGLRTLAPLDSQVSIVGKIMF